MVASITTLGTPHNGTPAADKIGTRKLVKETINRIGRLSGGKDVDIDLGFSQWGLKQQPNESYIDYAERVSKSKIWNTEDQAVNDLTTQGAEKINQQTSLNLILSTLLIQGQRLTQDLLVMNYLILVKFFC